MSRLTPELRRCAVILRKKGLNKKVIANLLDTTRQAVHRWCKRAEKGYKLLKDKRRKAKESKITVEVEATVIGFRNFFKWGTARIKQALVSIPEFMKEVFPTLVQGVHLSRTTINNLLIRHKLNGYINKKPREWKFFRAAKPDELWQIDLKGPYTIQGQKLYFLAVIDDYSRYLVLTESFDHAPTTEELTKLLSGLERKPTKILADNGPQFRKKWKRWCKENGIEPISAHPYYPQDKGKVERVIRTLTEEFLHLVRKVPHWLQKLNDYTLWYNTKRYHLGIKTIPSRIYKV